MSASPESLTREERVAHALAIAACVFYAAVALWGLLGPLPGGDYGNSAALAIAGENIAHWHRFAFIPNYFSVTPSPEGYYCHHPYGVPFLSAFASLLFGHHWLAVRMPAILCSAFSAPLVYAIGRAMWGVLPAAFATLMFVLVPVDLAFNDFTSFEVPTIFFGLVFSWGTVRLWQTWEGKWVAVAALGALGAVQSDWLGLILVGTVVAFGFVRTYVLPRRWYEPVDERLAALWFSYVTAVAVGSFLLYLGLFGKANRIDDLVQSYQIRTNVPPAEWANPLVPHRKMLLTWLLTPVGRAALMCALPMSFVRLSRRPAEIIPIAWTVAAAFHYFVFQQAADVFPFWPHYFGPAAALAGGVFVDSLQWTARGLSTSSPSADKAWKVGFAIFLVAPLLLLARMAFPVLVQARKTGGRFDGAGHHIDTDADIAQFAQWAGRGVPPSGRLMLHGANIGYAGEYGARRLAWPTAGSLPASQPDNPDRFAMADARIVPTSELQVLARRFVVQAAGPFWRIDRAAPGPNFGALRYVERQPGPLEWLFVSGTDLVRTIGPDFDPFVTWEWNDAFGLNPLSPTPAPGTFDEIRIAHNVAVSRDNASDAAALRARLMAKAKHAMRIDFTDDVHLLDIEVESGAATVVTFLWETGADFRRVDGYFDVTCRVVQKPALWPAGVDSTPQDVSPAPAIRPQLWKAGYLYTQRFVALGAMGTETCRGAFTVSGPRPTSGAADIALFTLP